ncbi:hypothetical protein THIARS_70167 [Thiomonas delicata]|uniref:Uncharacterized protein n=1 Tax=Thiomonas delicata TaxID=364030 RepID=A0A238D5G0_THIDL|nr:hypothetical protein THIARS_70167 [Thiomonas delicata]
MLGIHHITLFPLFAALRNMPLGSVPDL